MKKLRVRLYFKPNVIWYYQVIDDQCGANNLIYALDRNQDEIEVRKKRIALCGVVQKPEIFTHTSDMRRRIINQ